MDKIISKTLELLAIYKLGNYNENPETKKCLDEILKICNDNIDPPKKLRGRPKLNNEVVEVVEPVKKYLLVFNGVEHKCNTLSEIAKITGKSEKCIFRIVSGEIKFKKNTSEELKNIVITKLKNKPDENIEKLPEIKN